jgi:hypothetical protein
METFTGYKPKVCSRFYFAKMAHFTAFSASLDGWIHTLMPIPRPFFPGTPYRRFSA